MGGQRETCLFLLGCMTTRVAELQLSLSKSVLAGQGCISAGVKGRLHSSTYRFHKERSGENNSPLSRFPILVSALKRRLGFFIVFFSQGRDCGGRTDSDWFFQGAKRTNNWTEKRPKRRRHRQIRQLTNFLSAPTFLCSASLRKLLLIQATDSLCLLSTRSSSAPTHRAQPRPPHPHC